MDIGKAFARWRHPAMGSEFYRKRGRGKMSVHPSVCLSVCLSHAGIVSKPLNVFVNSIHH